MTTCKHDLAVALRLLWKRPGFTIFATLTMSLGIGAATAIFSAVYGVLLRPLGLVDPPSITLVRLHREGNEGDVSGFYPRYLEDLKAKLSPSPAVSEITSYVYDSVTLGGDGGRREVADAVMVTTSFFDVMKVKPIFGRALLPEDEIARKRARVAVIAEGMWRSRLGGTPDIVGATLLVGGEPMEVVGVVPSGLPLPDASVELWIPQSWDPDDVTLFGRVTRPGRRRAFRSIRSPSTTISPTRFPAKSCHPAT